MKCLKMCLSVLDTQPGLRLLYPHSWTKDAETFAESLWVNCVAPYMVFGNLSETRKFGLGGTFETQ